MAQHMSYHHLVLHRTVGFQQKTIGGVGVNYEVVHGLYPMIGLAEGPVWIAARQGIRADFIHHRCGNNLEIGGKRIEPEFASNIPDLLERFLQRSYFAIFHNSCQPDWSANSESRPLACRRTA